MPNGLPMTKTEIQLDLPEEKKIYFTSDWHLGFPGYETSLRREKKIVEWLNRIEKNTYALFLVGDIFDFWFDYKHAVPGNFTRVLGKLAQMADKGIRIYYFFGNHDMWHQDYLKKEIGLHIIPDTASVQVNMHKIFVAHGDGLGPGDISYKILKKIFRNPVSQFLFRWLHPDLGIPLARFFSKTSRNHTPEDITRFLGEENEHLIVFSKKILEKEHYDYFVFGHRHHMVKHRLNDRSVYLNIGDWLKHFSYAVFNGDKMELKIFDK